MITNVGMARIKSKSKSFVIAGLLLISAMMGWMATSLANDQQVHIVAFGDSLTAGYGLPPKADFASKLQSALRDRGLAVRISNAGVSGDTTTGGLARFDWAIPADADAVILELGANDALRGIAPSIAKSNLDKILSKLKSRKIPVLLAGMQAPANWGDQYKKDFDGLFSQLAKKHETLLYPFFLEGVIDKPSLKLPDALHPNEQGVDEIVRRILPSVEQLIARARSKS